MESKSLTKCLMKPSTAVGSVILGDMMSDSACALSSSPRGLVCSA